MESLVNSLPRKKADATWAVENVTPVKGSKTIEINRKDPKYCSGCKYIIGVLSPKVQVTRFSINI